MNTQVVTTTNFRKNIASFLGAVTATGKVLTVGKREQPEVVILPFPKNYRSDVSNLTNLMANNPTFNFLEEEPDLYSVKDVKKTYS